MLDAWLIALPVMALVAVATWLLSVVRRDVSVVDILWGLFFGVAALTYLQATPVTVASERAWLITALVLIWALRLSGHIAWRSHGKPEDRRYQEIRANNEPGFAFKSLYLVFLLQAVIAWIVSVPILAAIQPGVVAPASLTWLDLCGLFFWLAGMGFEVVSDWQLARFQRDPANTGKVLSTGLWRYSRHPNYFGEFLIWWGYFLIALAANGWWAVISPLIMTVLLLKVSGVGLMETGMKERRPGYAEYVRRTSTFFPAAPKA